MDLEKILTWLLVPAVAGLAWIARSVSRIESEVGTLKANNTEMWRQINKHTEAISDVGKSVARIEGHLEK